MADDKPTPEHSGSRWEPGPDDETRRIVADESAPTPAPPPDQPPVPGADQPPAAAKPRGRARSIGVPVAAAVAAGLIVVSGAGGYVLGSATSGDGLDRVSFQRGGSPQGGPGGWGDHDDGDGHRVAPGPPPGTNGQLPGFPGDDEGDAPEDGGSDQDSGSTT